MITYIKTQSTIFKEFLRYVSLNVCSMVGISCYILADTFFIANGVGADGLSALNLALPIYGLMMSLSIMVGMGTAARYAILHAQGRCEESNTYFTHGLFFAVSIGLLIFLTGQLFAKPLAIIMGADQSTLKLTAIYIKTTTFFAPFFVTNSLMNVMVKNDLSPKLAMVSMLAGSFSNIILDYVFIFPLDMGMFGAALATGIAPVISLCILSLHFINGKNQFKLIRCQKQIKIFLKVAVLGFSPFFLEFSSSVVVFAFNLVILKLAGNTGVAAYGIIANMALVVTGIYNGIAQGMQPMVSAYYGKGNSKNIQKILKYALVFALTASVIMYAVLFILRGNIIQLFNKDNIEALSALAHVGIPIYFIGIFFAGLNIICSTYFTSIEQIISAAIISLMRGGCVIIPAVLVLSRLFQINGVWASFPVSELLTTITAAILFIRFQSQGYCSPTR